MSNKEEEVLARPRHEPAMCKELRDARVLKNYSISAVARLLGVPWTTYADIEKRGTSDWYDLREWLRIILETPPQAEDPEQLGVDLKRIRLSKSLSRTDAAFLCGITPATLCRWEGGNVSGNATMTHVMRAITVLNAVHEGQIPVLRVPPVHHESKRTLRKKAEGVEATHSLPVLHALLKCALENNVNATKTALQYVEGMLADPQETEGT